ncbi:YIP1 family protein [Halobellus sp. EA9]|uniref:YIP1 family protein n=1 Tax=Halobellus sp. EA9 TaxID=3421647 RepID=UPI003EBFE18E
MSPVTPLVRPGRFFAERDVTVGHTLALLALHVFALPLGVWAVGRVFQARIDGTVMVDNPSRPSEQFCETAPESMDADCDAPAEVERNIDALLADAVGEFIGPVLIGIGIVIVLVAVALHAGARLFDGERGIATSLAVALWGLVPPLVSLVVGLGLLFVLIDPITVASQSDPSVLTERIRADLAPLVRWQPLVTGATSLWSGLVWRAGLRHEQGLSNGAATGTAGTVALIVWLFSLA